MARREPITDPEKRARICRCYAENRSLEETGRIYRLSAETVRRIIEEDQPGLLPHTRRRKQPS